MITSNLIKILPKNLKQKVEHNYELRKIMGNINWLTFENIFRNLISIFVFAWIARYLGPEQFGLMNYALSFVALFSVLSTLGLDDIVIRNIVSDQDNKDKYLGSTLLLKFLGSLLMLALSVWAIYLVERENTVLIIFVFILSFGYLFKSLDVIDLWFKSQIQSQYSVYSRLIAFLIISAIKIILILTQAPLVAFVLMFTTDFFLASLLLIYFYYRRTKISIFKWKISIDVIKGLLRDSWPLILSGMAVLIYMRTGQIMVGNMLGERELGIYSSAVKLSEAWYFIPTVVMVSVFPSIVAIRKKSIELYLRRLQFIFDLFVWFTIIIAIIVTLFSEFIITMLYGVEYLEASIILSIHIWAAVPVFLGVVVGKYLITENLTKISFLMTLSGAISSIILNIILIPRLGIVGSALSVLFSYTIATFITVMFNKTRFLVFMILDSFNIIKVITRIKE